MRVYLADSIGVIYGMDEREPKCGEDFCDYCGDCLHCNGSDECSENDHGSHRWVIYDDEKRQ